jgi:hypothetical protein
LLLVVASRNIVAVYTLYNAVFKAQANWDIYSSGVYRYGPSIIENNDGSIDVWFSAPGEEYGEKVLYFNEAGTHDPVRLLTNNTAAQKFTATDPFYAIDVACPSWGTSNSSLTLSLYKWQTDYSTTLASAVVATQIYTNYVDNQNLQLAKDDKFTSGEYLWVLSNPSGTAGVWKKEREVSGVTNYLNGQAVTGSYRAFTFINPSKGGYYWDQVAYRRSTDGGKTWTEDQMVLKPTEDTRDQFSVCDPGVVKSGTYYYIGYTSTEDARGLFNHAYVARSASPTGPWEKWNGNGWGDSPQPVVTFTGDRDAWGAGEPSMVVNNGRIFFYYSWNLLQTTETRVATANVNDTNWPAHLNYHGMAINKTTIAIADHCDVKYRKDLHKFYAIHTASRFTQNSYVVLWESSDGLSFSKIAEIRDNLKPYLHNCGWSGDENGLINPAKQQYLSYAYGPNGGGWNTAWHPITFD